ncbi:MAG: glycosyltransferase family 39 protein [Lentisphaeria bacterium]|nr:glycosyltransferase family 39 protein [Lentisphaeria bacterium]
MRWDCEFGKNLDPRRVFFLALGLGLALSLLSVFFSYDIYRDSAGVYAYFSREIGNGNFQDGWVGRVPMLNILLAGGLAALGMEAYKATIVVSCMFYILTLFPLRRYLERYLTPIQAAWGCVMFAAAPKLIRYSVSGLIDSSRYFFLILSLLCLFRVIDGRKIRDAVFLGLALGGLSVSRGEEFIFAGMILFVLWLAPFIVKDNPERSFSRRRGFALTLASAVVWFVSISPFCLLNLHYEHVFATDVRIADCVNRGERQQKPALYETGDAHHDKPFGKRAEKTLRDVFRGGYELYWFFSIVGCIWLLKYGKWRWEFSLIWLIFILHSLIYLAVSTAYRYSIYLIPLFMPFSVTGVALLWKKMEQISFWRYLKPAMTLVLALIVVLQVINGMKCVTDRDDVEKRKIAAFIRQWGEDNRPGRRLRLAGMVWPESVYWSGAYSVFNYKSGAKDLKTFRDFDLLLIPGAQYPILSGQTDFVELELPIDQTKRPFSKRIFLFRLKAAGE